VHTAAIASEELGQAGRCTRARERPACPRIVNYFDRAQVYEPLGLMHLLTG
jgi:hypothetical protein